MHCWKAHLSDVAAGDLCDQDNYAQTVLVTSAVFHIKNPAQAAVPGCVLLQVYAFAGYLVKCACIRRAAGIVRVATIISRAEERVIEWACYELIITTVGPKVISTRAAPIVVLTARKYG
jgi:hypothetical protein